VITAWDNIYAIFDLAWANNSTSKDRGESIPEKVSTTFCRQTQDCIYNPSQAVYKLPVDKRQVSYGAQSKLINPDSRQYLKTMTEGI